MKRQWANEELVEHWSLDVEDRALLGNKTVADAGEVTAWLVEQVLPREHHEERLRDMAYQRFRALDFRSNNEPAHAAHAGEASNPSL
jgi:hypothetical protein